MGVAHRVADLHHELEPAGDRELVLVAVPGERHAFDQLHREVGQPVGGHPALEEPRDAGMLEQRQDPALLEEAAEHPRRAPLDELDRGALLELAVGPLTEVHRPHAAPAEQPDDAPGADALGGAALGEEGGVEQRARHRQGRLEEALAAVRVQQAQHLRVDLGVVAGGALGERHLLVGGDVEQGVEDGVDAAVAVGRRGEHRCGPRCVPATRCATMAGGRAPVPQSPGETPAPNQERRHGTPAARPNLLSLPSWRWRPRPSGWRTWRSSPPADGHRDAIGVVDTNPDSRAFGRLVGLTDFPHGGNELHHFGWNACSSHLCPYAANAHVERRYLVVPGTHSLAHPHPRYQARSAAARSCRR